MGIKLRDYRLQPTSTLELKQNTTPMSAWANTAVTPVVSLKTVIEEQKLEKIGNIAEIEQPEETQTTAYQKTQHIHFREVEDFTEFDDLYSFDHQSKYDRRNKSTGKIGEFKKVCKSARYSNSVFEKEPIVKQELSYDDYVYNWMHRW